MDVGRVSRNRDACRDVRVSGFAARPALDDGVVGAIGEQGFEDREVEAVAAAIGVVGGEKRIAGEREVADGVERLVTDELIREAQTFRVDDGVLPDRDRVVERSAEGEAGLPELFDVADEAEGAGAGDFLAVFGGGEIEDPPLAADDRVVEVDLDIETEAAPAWLQFGEGPAARDADRLQNLQVAAGRPYRRQPVLLDGGHEGGRAAVEDGKLRAVDLDQDVVDAEPAEGGHQVLDDGDRAAFRLPDDGAEFGGRHREMAGFDEAVVAAGEPRSEKNDAVVRFGRVKDDFDFAARVNPHSSQDDRRAKRRLLCLFHFSQPRPSPIVARLASRLIEPSVRCFRPLVTNAPLQGAPPFSCRGRTIVMAALRAKSRFLTLCYINRILSRSR